ncbi:MAG: hypothetical protein A3I05_03900 [Deltaproteobacteria bacterium RIFCSPLOWO2_02_FULL_44_10]|nr:MAG: hypothetical protein A3C46_08010 [Deltaproteobacteria bacterium RIFCSPHIGHO2_02_FULL_44_16]OGQ47106.1 MAG: hypothetical protein A3I05_03900 [Deltaproteobacteria bacterium RIFCSPLOWO2_02_FULL_44_10]
MIDSLLKNKFANDFSIHEHGFCSLSLEDGYTISIETLCRFISNDGKFISSSDHGHQFGLPAPFNAAQAIKEQIHKKKIINIEVKNDTGDLILFFENGRLEIICSSSGYECYQLNGPDNLIIVGRGGPASFVP